MTQVLKESQAIEPAEREAALLNLCKLLLDEDRLKILGALAQQAWPVDTLAQQLRVNRLPVHLHKLAEAGLVNQGIEQGVEFYQLDSQQILKLKKRLFARDEASEAQSPDEQDLAKFVKRDQVAQLPVHPAKLRLVLNWLADKFQINVEYSERAVNELLKGLTADPVAADHVTLRRLLIDHLLLVRQAGIYQRNANRVEKIDSVRLDER